ncbi:MAG: GWxTD domain-containing protein [Bacteroidota bacterium]
MAACRLIFTAPAGLLRRMLLAVPVLAVVALTAPTAFSQPTAYEPEFFAETMVLPVAGQEGSDQGRLDLYAAAPYQNLRFLSLDEGFVATYTITADIYRADADGNARTLVESRQWERRVAVPIYEATQADSLFDHTTQSVTLPTGRYLVEMQLEDGSSRRTFVREAAVEVPDYRTGIALAGPLLLDRYDPEAQTLAPNVANVLYMDRDELTLFYEVYSDQARTLTVTYEIVPIARSRELPSARNVARGLLGMEPADDEAEAGTPEVQGETRIDVQPGTSPATLALPMEDFKAGTYQLTFALSEQDGGPLAQVTKSFDVRWTGLAAQIEDLDAAIAQLRYVAKERDVRDILDAPTQEERLRRFVSFWERRDPTPGTRRNERMEEYYYRVFFANENYSRFSENGWNTDRGEVFVRFGEPDLVEEHTFNYNVEPYEIWYYNRLGRRFIFVDERGFGNYRLLYPIHDDRTRM